MFELIAQYGLPVLYWILALLAGLVSKHVVTLTSNKWAQGVIQRAYVEIDDAVKLVAQTYVDEIKRASEDGSLSEEEKLVAKKMAVEVFKDNFGGSAALKRLAKALGLNDVVGWVVDKVEVSVATNKGIAPPR